MTHGCKGAFNRIGGANVFPVFSREIVEGEQLIAILGQASNGLVVFGTIFFGKMIERFFCVFARFRHPDLVEIRFCLGLHRLRHLIENVAYPSSSSR